MRRIILLFLISLVSFTFTVSNENVEAAGSCHKAMKVYVKNPYELNQIIGAGIDVIEFESNSLKVFATAEQISWLEEIGFENEEIALSEVLDETVVRKTDAGLYHTYSEVVTELHQIESTHGNIAKIYIIGQSIENRDILAIKISDNPSLEETEESEILYMGCHHAREWISVEIPMYLTNYLVNNYGTDPTITNLIDERETWIVPIVNPDGLEYSQTVYTMWRKNKRDNDDDGIFDPSYDGVDCNRNYGFMWGYDDIGSSPYPWSEIYRGAYAFSEPENQAIRDLALKHKFVFSISYHSYGELIIYPWGYISEDTPDDKLFTDIAAKMAEYNGYLYGNAKDGIIYNTNGDSDDWLYGSKRTLAYTFELGTMFIPPETQIEEIWLRNREASLYLLQIADNPRQIYPSIKISTDKVSYAKGETMKVGLNLTNPHDAVSVGVGVWVDMPSGAKYWVVREPWISLPRSFSYSNPAWKSYTLPSLQSGNYAWHAIVVDPSTYYMLSESVAHWAFNGTSYEDRKTF